jgi:cytokine receptor domeless
LEKIRHLTLHPFYQCEGYLQWEEVDASVRMRNITLDKDGVYQFAVSANAPGRSSGMVWATCTILHNKVVGKLKTVAVDVVVRDSMKVSWRLDCSDRVGIVVGYRISFCEIESPLDTADCVGKEKHLDTPPDKESVWVEHLKPWTYYKVSQEMLMTA